MHSSFCALRTHFIIAVHSVLVCDSLTNTFLTTWFKYFMGPIVLDRFKPVSRQPKVFFQVKEEKKKKWKTWKWKEKICFLLTKNFYGLQLFSFFYFLHFFIFFIFLFSSFFIFFQNFGESREEKSYFFLFSRIKKVLSLHF